MLISKAIEGFVLSITADGYSPRTVGIYTWALERLKQFLGDVEVESIKSNDLQRWFAHLQTTYQPKRVGGNTAPLAQGSLLNAWTSMRSFYNWCARELKTERPDHAVKKPIVPIVEVQPFSEDEVERMVRACERSAKAKTTRRNTYTMKRATAARDTALIMLMLDTGLRASEVCRLRVENISLPTGEVTIVPHRTGRKAKSRHVYIGKITQRALWRYFAQRQAQPNEYAFTNRNFRPMERYTLRTLLYRIAQRAKVENCHPHRFRHTFAIQFLRNGGNVFELQRLLGHSSLEMVRRYVALADSDAASAHRRASPVDRWQL